MLKLHDLSSSSGQLYKEDFLSREETEAQREKNILPKVLQLLSGGCGIQTMSLKFQSLSSVLLQDQSRKSGKIRTYKGKNKISISPEITVNILVYFLLFFYICG